jgi:excisionase family DNA binding protein
VATQITGEGTITGIMTAAEVAAWLRVGLSTVYAWTGRGRIPHLKLNGVIRYQRSELSEWLQQHSVRSAASSHNGIDPMIVARPRPLTYRAMTEAAARVKRRLISSKTSIHHSVNP